MSDCSSVFNEAISTEGEVEGVADTEDVADEVGVTLGVGTDSVEDF